MKFAVLKFPGSNCDRDMYNAAIKSGVQAEYVDYRNNDLCKDFVIHGDGSQPELGSAYCKTTTWSCLSGTTCSHVCSRTSSCFGAYYRRSSPENLATSSRRFVLQTFIFLPRLDESGIS